MAICVCKAGHSTSRNIVLTYVHANAGFRPGNGSRGACALLVCETRRESVAVGGRIWRRIRFIISVIDRGRNHFDRGRNNFDRGRNHFDRGRNHFDLGRIHFDRGRIHFDRGRIHFDRGRIHFDRGRIHFDRGRIHFKSHTSANHKASYKDPVYLCM